MAVASLDLKMTVATVKLTSIGPYSQSRKFEDDRGDNEPHEAYRQRVWRRHCHTNQSGEIYIPPMAVKNGLAETARRLGMTIPGKGKSTYTKRFEGGLMVTDPIMLGIQLDDVDSETLFLPSDGKRGSGSRVFKTYPLIREWQAEFDVHILDEVITEKVFRTHMEYFGMFVGLGRFRPEKNGFYGRFKLEGVKWG